MFADALVQRMFGSRPTQVEKSGVHYLAEMRQHPEPSLGTYLAHMQANNPLSKNKFSAVWNDLKEFFSSNNSTKLSGLEDVADINTFVKRFKEQDFMQDGEASAPNTTPALSPPSVSEASSTSRSQPSSRASNNSSISTLSARSVEKMKAEYEQNFATFQDEAWTLSSGTSFDEIVAQYVRSLNKESSLHSFVINHPDTILELFPNPNDKVELEKILIERKDERAKLTDETEERYLREYNKEPVVVYEMLSRGWQSESQDPAPQIRESIHLALHLIFVVYRNSQFSLPEESSESFFLQTLWGGINPVIQCDDALKFKPAEVYSKASAIRKNKDRRPEDSTKQALGRKVDGVVASTSTLLELCIIEAANKDHGPNGTKALSKVLKDSFDAICSRANTDIRSLLAVYGVRISGASITYYSLRKRKGRFYQMANDGTVTFPAQWNKTTTITILTIVASILALRKRVSDMAQQVAQWTASSFELSDPWTHPCMPPTLRTPPGSPRLAPQDPHV